MTSRSDLDAQTKQVLVGDAEGAHEKKNIRILHITEAMASGTLHVLSLLARAQASSGCSVCVVHSVRHDTPSDLDRVLPPPIVRVVVPMVTSFSPLADFRSAIKLIEQIRSFKPEVVHLHSSKAGGIGRLVCRLLGLKSVYYSPHGFAFLRRDVSRFKQRMFLAFEAILSRLGATTVACSESEGRLAREVVGCRRVVVVENAVEISSVLVASHSARKRIRVVSSGRLCYQKAPWLFFSLAEALKSTGAEFIWIGAGEKAYQERLIRDKPDNVQITGWVNGETVASLLASADIYVLLSLWEGMPLVLIEAQASGLPAVVSNVVGSRDVVQNGISGFICDTHDEAVDRVKQLINDTELRVRQGGAARSAAVRRFDAARMNREMLAIYTQLSSR